MNHRALARVLLKLLPHGTVVEATQAIVRADHGAGMERRVIPAQPLARRARRCEGEAKTSFSQVLWVGAAGGDLTLYAGVRALRDPPAHAAV